MKSACLYELGRYDEAGLILKSRQTVDAVTLANEGTIFFGKGDYEAALLKFKQASSISEKQQSSELEYYIALCQYRLKNYGESQETLNQIIGKAFQNHPALLPQPFNSQQSAFSGSASPGHLRLSREGSVVVSQEILKSSGIVEALNLKATIEMQRGNQVGARATLALVPNQTNSTRESLDAITLHNQAILEATTNAPGSLDKLSSLFVSHTEGKKKAPPQLVPNLLFMLCNSSLYSQASKLLEIVGKDEMSQIINNDKEMAYVEALLKQAQATTPQEIKVAEQHFSALYLDLRQQLEAMPNEEQKMTSDPQQSFGWGNEETKSNGMEIKMQRKQLRQEYLSLVIAQAKAYWQQKNYTKVEAVLNSHQHFCLDGSEEDNQYLANQGHAIYMQGQSSKYPEAVAKYLRILQSESDILKVDPMVLANLCVCYILIKQNSKAESLIKKVETSENKLRGRTTEQIGFRSHASIVNLVIGSLYCSKGNFDFGLSLMMKSLRPLSSKLATDSWYYFKRCLIALVERLVRKRIAIDNKLYENLLNFLDEVGNAGRQMLAGLGGCNELAKDKQKGNSIGDEADFLKKVLVKLQAGALSALGKQ